MMKLSKNAQKSIIRNRVKLLTLDYFDLTAPLLASEILSTKKHKEIKAEASSSKGRVDLLLDWMEESAPEAAYPAFLQGIKNCNELMLSRKMKKEAADGYLGPPPKSFALPKPSVVLPASTSVTPLTPGTSDKTAAAKPKKPKKPAAGVKTDTGSIGVFSSAPSLNGLPADFPGSSTPTSLPTNKAATSAKSSRKSTNEKKTPGKSKSLDVNGTPKIDLAVKALMKKEKNIKQIAKKTVANSSLLPATPRATRKSSSSEKGEDGGDAKPPKAKKKKVDAGSAPAEGTPKIKKAKAPGKVGGTAATTTATNAASKPKSPVKNAGGKAKPMSFKQVVDKQADFRQKFRFKNTDAVAKVIHFKDKTDISYLACPFEEGDGICEKKVELKSKEFICEVKHKNPNCKQIPYLNLTCNDGTADLQLTLMKQDVEVFCGKSAVELSGLSVNEIKESLDKTVGKKLSVEVSCERLTKGVKKGGSPIWKNLATILSDNDGPSPAKKKRKN